MDAPKPGTSDPAYFPHRQKRRNRARKETLEFARRDERLNRRQNNPHRAAHCEHMIDGYLRDRRDALRHETPAQRARPAAPPPRRSAPVRAVPYDGPDEDDIDQVDLNG
ncbi:MAG TPA: hypothetical protein VGI81_15635 [Tepidisphaeraceae bacterium]|jgi:hypothetical protein